MIAWNLLCILFAGAFLLSTGDDYDGPDPGTGDDYDKDPGQKAFEDNIADYMDNGQDKTFDGKDYYGRLGLLDRTYCHCIFGDEDVVLRGRCFGKIATIFAKCVKASMEEACDRKLRKMIDSCKEDACNVEECKESSRPFGPLLREESAFEKPTLRKSKPAGMHA